MDVASTTVVTRTRGSLRRLQTPGVLVGCAVASAVVFLLVGAREVWFFGDDWAFLITRREMWAEGEHFAYLFEPHNEHLSTIPVVINSALFKVFGLNSFLPYMVPVLAAHAALAILLYRLMLRCRVDAWVAAGMAAVFAFLGTGAENLAWAFQIGFVGAMALGVGQVLLADHDGPLSARDWCGSLLAVLGVLTAGVAVTMVTTVGLLLVVRRRWIPAVVHTVPAATIYLIWYVGYGAERMTRFPSDASLIPPYVAFGLSDALDGLTQLPPAGMAIGIGVLLVVVADRVVPVSPAMPAVVMAAGSVVLFTINGYGRATLGIDQAGSSRYTYLAIALLLPLVALGLTAVLAYRGRALTIVVALFIGWALLGNISAYYIQRQGLIGVIRPASERILASAAYASLSTADPQLIVEPTRSTPVTVAVLRDLIVSGDLDPPDPTSDSLDLDPATLSQAAIDLGIAAGPRGGHSTGEPVVVSAIGDAGVRQEEPGCVTLTPAGPNPRIEVSADGSDEFTVRGSSGVDATAGSARREFATDPSVATPFRVELDDLLVTFEFDPGNETTVCHVVTP